MRNKENLNKWQRAYYHRKKRDPKYQEQKKAAAKRYYLLHKPEIAARRKKYRLKTIDKYKAYRREWKRSNPRGIYSCIKQSAKKRDLELSISVDGFVNWWNNITKRCYYCNRSLKKIISSDDSVNNRATRLTIDRADNNNGYTADNIRLACYRCNSIKGDYFTETEMLGIGTIINVKELAR